MMRMKRMKRGAGKEGITRKTKVSKKMLYFWCCLLLNQKMLVDDLYSLQNVCDEKIIKRKFMKTNVDFKNVNIVL